MKPKGVIIVPAANVFDILAKLIAQYPLEKIRSQNFAISFII